MVRRASSSTAWKERTEAATVWLPDRRGRGVLVPGGFVLTAAHCVNSYNTGGMALGDHCLETVKPKRGPAFRLSVFAVEPVTDIAVLGEPDNQVFYDDAEAFEGFCEMTPAVPVHAEDLERDTAVRVHVLKRNGTWVHAMTSRRLHEAPSHTWITLLRGAMLAGGDSGGPVVDGSGLLVGLVSQGLRDGSIPRPHRALPVWLWHRIESAQRALDANAAGARKTTARSSVKTPRGGVAPPDARRR